LRYVVNEVTGLGHPGGPKLREPKIDVVYTANYSCFTTKAGADGAALAAACGVVFDVNLETKDPNRPINTPIDADKLAKSIADAIGCTTVTNVKPSAVGALGLWRSSWKCTTPAAGGPSSTGGARTALQCAFSKAEIFIGC
jgi:hypothetical protein